MIKLKEQAKQIKKSLDNINQEFENYNDTLRYKTIFDKFNHLVNILDEIDIAMYDKLSKVILDSQDEVNYFLTKYSK